MRARATPPALMRTGVSSPRAARLIHPVHSALWTFLRAFGPSMQAQAVAGGTAFSSVLWQMMGSLCAEMKASDMALYMTCAHGLGHSLAFLVSDGVTSIHGALDVCAEASPDGAMVFNCADGVMHERQVRP